MVIVHIKVLIVDKIISCIVNLLSLWKTPIKVCKPLYTLQDVVQKKKQNLNFKEKLRELQFVFFTYLSLSSEDNK